MHAIIPVLLAKNSGRAVLAGIRERLAKQLSPTTDAVACVKPREEATRDGIFREMMEKKKTKYVQIVYAVVPYGVERAVERTTTSGLPRHKRAERGSGQ